VIRTVVATRYVTPLREGGSLPAIIEADDLGTYVLKFRGAGQGPKVLVAELLAGEIGRALGLPVPELVFVELDSLIGRSEPDPEIQYLIRASEGLNFALDYLPGSFAFDPAITPPPDGWLASKIVWFDAYMTNVDRTAKNTNMLIWHRQLYLIDHGSALYVHHAPGSFVQRAADPFGAIKDHVLLPLANDIEGAGDRLATALTSAVLEDIVGLLPSAWIENGSVSADARRAEYLEYLSLRLQSSRSFVRAALDARSHLV
jgi:HipA-like protein